MIGINQSLAPHSNDVNTSVEVRVWGEKLLFKKLSGGAGWTLME